TQPRPSVERPARRKEAHRRHHKRRNLMHSHPNREVGRSPHEVDESERQQRLPPRRMSTERGILCRAHSSILPADRPVESHGRNTTRPPPSLAFHALSTSLNGTLFAFDSNGSRAASFRNSASDAKIL